MSSKKATTWLAKPHTIAKIKILESYLIPYFEIMGRTHPGEQIIYVDGFAGPGKYKNYGSGSPIAALRAASTVISTAGPKFKARGITCIFIEKSKKRFKSLQALTSSFAVSPKLEVVAINSDFVEASKLIEKTWPETFRSSPIFFFIDPFGVSQVPIALIERILKNPKSEVFLNFNAPGVNRIFLAGEFAKSEAILKIALGDLEPWSMELASLSNNSLRARLILDIYRTKLRNLRGVNYTFPFEMRNASDRLEYFLLFAGHHYLGLEKMKESMRQIAGNSSYVFSDAHEGRQHELFAEDDISYYADELHRQFSSSNHTYSATRDFALNETPFANPKAMLKSLEGDAKIEVQAKQGIQRRKGSFPEEKIELIKFSAYESLFN